MPNKDTYDGTCIMCNERAVYWVQDLKQTVPLADDKFYRYIMYGELHAFCGAHYRRSRRYSPDGQRNYLMENMEDQLEAIDEASHNQAQ